MGEEKRQAHNHISDELRRLEEENHRLQKKYKKVKRRASKSGISRNSTMKIMRNAATPNADLDADAAGDAAPFAAEDSAGQPEQPESVKETAPESAADNPEGGADDNPKKKKKRGWFG